MGVSPRSDKVETDIFETFFASGAQITAQVGAIQTLLPRTSNSEISARFGPLTSCTDLTSLMDLIGLLLLV